MKVKLLIGLVALSFVASGSLMAQDPLNHVYITGVTNTAPAGDFTTDDQLDADAGVHVVTIYFEAPAVDDVVYAWLGTNAFEMYSPDGADWGYLAAVRGQYVWDLPLLYTDTIKCQAVESFLKHANKTGGSGDFVITPSIGDIPKCFTGGFVIIEDPYTTVAAGGNVSGTDTVGFFHGVVGTGVGMFDGTQGDALTAEFTTSVADVGKHICFDTTGQIQAWEWAAAGYPHNSGSDFPTWDNGQGVDGPLCWMITSPSDVSVEGHGNLPTKFDLNQNYPNPFNPSTTINFDIPKKTHATLTVFNVLGQKVATLINEELAPDSYEVQWNGEADGGHQIASGIYFYRLKADQFVSTKKMLLLK